VTTTISVGGRASVATEHLEQLAARLERASAECFEVIVRIPPLRTNDDAAREADLADIDRTMRQARDRLHDLSRSLRFAVDLYSSTELAAASAVETVLAQLAATVGFAASRLGLVLLPGLVQAAIASTALWALLPAAVRDGASAVGAAAADRAVPALSDPRFVDSLRVALSLVDDAALGALGVPPSLVAALGESAADVSGIDTAALAVLGLAALAGSSGIDPVRVDRVGADRRRGEGTTASVPPTTLTDRVGRIPDVATPIVIERYPLPDGTWHFEVYIAGTDSQAELGGDRPWDMSSNVALVAEQHASSLQAVQVALRDAGATSSSPIVFTGYSQGGAIATALAESGEWSTAGLVTVGAPTGGMPVRGEYPAVVIEHREDLVPVLSGIRRETTAVVVRADGLSSEAAGHGPLPAHEIDRYEATAAAADAHGNATLQSTIAALPTPHTNGERMAFTATRLDRDAL
jgi:predicted esterase